MAAEHEPAPDRDRDPAPADKPLLPRWLWTVAAIVGGGYLLYLLRGALTPVFFGLLIAYVLDPVVDRFEARGMSRAVGIGVVTAGLVLLLAAVVFLVVPGIVRETITFAGQLPATLTSVLDRAEPILREYGIAVPNSFDDVRGQLQGVDTSKLVQGALSQLAGVGNFVLGGTASMLAAVASLVMIPVFAAYLLYDFDRMTAGIAELVPARHRAFVGETAQQADAILGEFMRGQLWIMLALAVLYSVGYSIVGVPLALGIGLVAGLLSFIPYVGGAVALGMAVVMSVLHWSGWGQLIGVGVVYAIVQLLENFVITPKVVGDKVGLPAVWVLFALLVGSELFGFLGVLLALPTAAVAKIFVMRGLASYRTSAFFVAGAPEPPAAPDSSLGVGVDDSHESLEGDTAAWVPGVASEPEPVSGDALWNEMGEDPEPPSAP